MKLIFRTFVVVLATVIAVACSKNDNGGSSSGGGGYNYVTPPLPCTPDQFGNVSTACGTPSTSTSSFNGSMNPLIGTRSDNNSIVQLIKRLQMYPIYPFRPPFGYGYPGSHGFFVVTGGFNTPFKPQCGTDDGFSTFYSHDSCISECKNFYQGMKLFLDIVNGYGTLHIQAGPYVVQGGCNNREAGLLRASDIQVRAMNTGGNQGFTVLSLNLGNRIQIDVPVGSLDPNVHGVTYNGTMSLNGQPLGSVTLNKP